MKLDKEATAVVLAALRLFQEEMQHNLRRVEQFPQLHEIDFEAIDVEYIDTLCEEINCAPDCVPASALRRLVHAVDHDIFTDAEEYRDRVRRAQQEINRAVNTLRGEKSKPMDLVELISNMTRDGESIDGNVFEMTPEDASTTLNELILEARKLRGRRR